MERVKLPKDGAAYYCTFSYEGLFECRQRAYEGLTEQDYVTLKNDPRLSYAHFMRAMCSGHLMVVETYLTQK